MAVTSDMKATVPTLGDDPNIPRDMLNAVNTVSAYSGRPVFASTAARDAAYTNAGITPSDGMCCTVAGVQQKYVQGGWFAQGRRQSIENNGFSGGAVNPGVTIGVTALSLSGVFAGSTVEAEFSVILYPASNAGGWVHSTLTGPAGLIDSRNVRWHDHSVVAMMSPAGRLVGLNSVAGTVTLNISVESDSLTTGAVSVWEVPVVMREIW